MHNQADLGRRNFLRQLSLTSIALLPATRALGELIDSGPAIDPVAAGSFLIDAAYRLVYYQQLLELEFYFLNVEQQTDHLGRRVLCPCVGKNRRLQPYMVVRLPQQHVAEQYVDSISLWKEKECPAEDYASKPLDSRISGYSYLCFSIDFRRLPKGAAHGLPVTAFDLMDWNAPHFELLAKPDNDIKPFVYEPSREEERKQSKNPDLLAPDIYPLGFLTKGGKRHYHRLNYPNQRNYPGGLRSNHDDLMQSMRDQAPFTALELPYRLIVSPRLPSWEYDHHWVFTAFRGVNCQASEPAELWMATLSLRKKKAHSLSARPQASGTAAGAETNQSSQEIVNQAENQLQLMILGPAGQGEYALGQQGTAPATTNPQPLLPHLLPDGQDRLDLVRLSTNFDLPTTTPALTFTPLGVCTHLAFRNKYFEKDRVALYQWKQAISFGRDQEVEVANVVVDATFGLKMLHVRTTRRETVKGRSPLIYREFLMPLELEKDFASFGEPNKPGSYQQFNQKYATPFQRVRFPDGSPRQVLPLARLQGDVCVRAADKDNKLQKAAEQNGKGNLTTPADKLSRTQGQAEGRLSARDLTKCPLEAPDRPEVLAFWAVSPDNRLLEWPLICTDWLGNETTLKRRLYLLRSQLTLDRNPQELPTYEYPAAEPETPENALRLLNDFIPLSSPSAFLLPLPAAAGSLSNVWEQIKAQTEQVGLLHLDLLRQSLETQLEQAERQLMAISTSGERDIEDLVLEEWGVLKRRMLSLETSWEGELHNLLHLAEKLREQLAESVAIQAELILIENLLKEKIVQLNNYLTSLGRESTAMVQAQYQQVLNGLKSTLEEVINQLLTRVLSHADIAKVLTIGREVQTDLEQRLVVVQQRALRELGPSYEQALFISRLPQQIRAEVLKSKEAADLGNCLYRVRTYGQRIQSIERELKSRIEAGKAPLCYAVHQASDEMESLKRALDEKYKQLRGVGQEAVRQSEEWLRDYENYSRDFGQAASGHLATMRTDYLIFRNNLRLAEANLRDGETALRRRVFDVFDSYPCYPQLHTAQVYAQAINELARREIPLKIKYAEDYVQNQLDNLALEVKNNAARVFAEVHSEGRELLKGALREAGKELGGLVNPEVAGHYLTLLKDGSAKAQANLDALARDGEQLAQDLRQASGAVLQTANTELNKLLHDQYQRLGQEYHQEFDRLRHGVLSMTKEAQQELRTAADDAKVQAQAFFKGLEAKILGSIRLRDLLGLDFDLPKLTRLPDKVTYQFLTRSFRPFDAKVFRFVPSERTTLSAYLELPTRSPENFKSQTKLSDFTLSIFDDRLLIEFKYIELLSDRQTKNKTNVALGQIGFGKELEFLAALTQGFAIPGTGLRVEPSPSNIRIVYALPIPGVSGGAFTFDNLKVNAGVTIPIPTGLGGANEPLGIQFGLNSPTDPFVIGVLIFGGMGHFLIETTPKYIRRIDTGLSFGGLFRINLVIASGQAFLQVGIRYVYERKETGESSMELYALLTCGANVTVFGFIDISVVFTMYLKYQKDSQGSALYGVASVACSVRIGFFRKSFTLSYSHRIAGSSPTEAPAPRPHRELPRPTGAPAAPSPARRLPAGGPPPVSAAAAAPSRPLPQPAEAAPPRQLAVPLPTGSARLARLERRRNRVLGRLSRAEHRLNRARRTEAEYHALAAAQQQQLQNKDQSLSQLTSLYATYRLTAISTC